MSAVGQAVEKHVYATARHDPVQSLGICNAGRKLLVFCICISYIHVCPALVGVLSLYQFEYRLEPRADSIR